VTANTVNKLYEWLKPEERFRLILAAGARGDMAERDRLSNTSRLLALKIRDFVPWAQAFSEVSMIIFMGLVEEAAEYQEALLDWSKVYRKLHQSANQAQALAEEDDEETDAASAESPEPAELSEDEKSENFLFEAHLAAGFILKTKLDGWKLFCERLNVPALVIWEVLPGYERLAAIIKQVEGTKAKRGAAFPPGGMMRFLRENRPAGRPEPTEAGLISAEKIAKELEEMFRDTVQKHGG
jgi:hypothetical protein